MIEVETEKEIVKEKLDTKCSTKGATKIDKEHKEKRRQKNKRGPKKLRKILEYGILNMWKEPNFTREDRRGKERQGVEVKNINQRMLLNLLLIEQHSASPIWVKIHPMSSWT